MNPGHWCLTASAGFLCFLEPHRLFMDYLNGISRRYGWDATSMFRQRQDSWRIHRNISFALRFWANKSCSVTHDSVCTGCKIVQKAVKKDKLFWEGLCFIFRVVLQLNQTGCLSLLASDDLLSIFLCQMLRFAWWNAFLKECFNSVPMRRSQPFQLVPLRNHQRAQPRWFPLLPLLSHSSQWRSIVAEYLMKGPQILTLRMLIRNQRNSPTSLLS